MKKALKTAARGTVFPYAGEKWVVLEHDPAGRTLCLRLDLIPNKPFDENNCNNFATSSSKEWMNGPYLDNLIDAVKGPNAFLQKEKTMEATKERAARRDRATPARTSGSSPAHGSRTQSITRRRRRAKARIRQTAVLLTAAVMVAGIGVAVSTIGTDRPTAADLPTPTAEQPAVVIQTPAASTQTPEPTEAPVRFYLSASERDTVERVVMAESGGESFEGQMLVAQCILNAAEKEGVQPSEAVVIYSYTSNRPDPTQSVKDAVAAVFDRGEVAIDAPVMYFYNPALVTSDWHESQIFVAEVGGHRFFAERSPAA